MKNQCPCCGSDMSGHTRPIVSLDTNRMLVGGDVIQLSAREAEIMSVLVDHMPLPVHNERLAARIYGASDIGTYNTLKVFVHRLRDKLRETTVRITTIHGKGHALEYKRAA